MGAEKKERGPLGRGVDALRQRTAMIERTITLGLVTLLAASFVHWTVTLRIVEPLVESHHMGPGLLTDLVTALLGQLGLLIVLPLFSWMLGWVFEGSPLKLCLGAAAFVEVWFLFIVYLADGSQVLLTRPVYLSAHLILALAAGLLGAKAFSHARGLSEKRERRGRRIAPDAAVAAAGPTAAEASEPEAPELEAPELEAPELEAPELGVTPAGSPPDADAAEPISEAGTEGDASGSATS